jgi:hypothetical protein
MKQAASRGVARSIPIAALCALALGVGLAPTPGAAAGTGCSAADDQLTTTIYTLWVLRGGTVTDASLARKLAEDLISGIYGTHALEGQEPLTVVDLGDRWQITGRDLSKGASQGYGAIRVVIAKCDGRIIDLQRPVVLALPHFVDAPK